MAAPPTAGTSVKVTAEETEQNARTVFAIVATVLSAGLLYATWKQDGTKTAYGIALVLYATLLAAPELAIRSGFLVPLLTVGLRLQRVGARHESRLLVAASAARWLLPIILGLLALVTVSGAVLLALFLSDRGSLPATVGVLVLLLVWQVLATLAYATWWVATLAETLAELADGPAEVEVPKQQLLWFVVLAGLIGGSLLQWADAT